MIEAPCDVCCADVEGKAALAFSPPDENNKSRKYHICKGCWPVIKSFFGDDIYVEQQSESGQESD